MSKCSKIKELYENGLINEASRLAGFHILDFICDYNNGLSYSEIRGPRSTVSIIKYAKLFRIYQNRQGKNKFGIKEIPSKFHLIQLIKNNYLCDVATDLGVHVDTLKKWLKFHRIKWKSKGSNISKSKSDQNDNITKELLLEKYECQKMGAIKIAKQLGTSQQVILSKLREFNINIRSNGRWQYDQNCYDKINDKEWLVTQYGAGFSASDIGKMVGCSDCTILQKLEDFGIERRSTIEYLDSKSSIHRSKLIPLLDKYNINHQNWVLKIKTSRNLICYEIDEYLPDHKIFIELQGTYWHGYGNINQIVANNVYRDIKKWRNLKREYPDHKIIYILETDFENGIADAIMENIVADHQIDKCEITIDHNRLVLCENKIDVAYLNFHLEDDCVVIDEFAQSMKNSHNKYLINHIINHFKKPICVEFYPHRKPGIYNNDIYSECGFRPVSVSETKHEMIKIGDKEIKFPIWPFITYMI